MSKCLYCYKEVDSGNDFHTECSLAFFGTETTPIIEYSLDEMNTLAKKVVERSVSVPGVQAKLSMSLLNEDKTDSRLTVVGTLGGNYIFKPPSKVYDVCDICRITGKLQDKSTPPIKKVNNGNVIKIANEIINTGNRLPSCSCFFFAYLAKKKITIIAIIIVVKKMSKFVQIGAGA